MFRPRFPHFAGSRVFSDAKQHKVVGSPTDYIQSQVAEGARLFMQAPNGALKVVQPKPRPDAMAQTQTSGQKAQSYSNALARYIFEQEKKGNKFFIQRPGGVIRRVSVLKQDAQPVSTNVAKS